MNFLVIFCLTFSCFSAISYAKIDPDTLRCLVCRVTIDELEKAILNIDPRKTVEVGNYRLDKSGNMQQTKVPLNKSQVYISELLDESCKKMNDYVRVNYKATGKLAVMKMMTDEGGMNPDFSLTDFVQDEDLNKSLEFYCEGIVGENDDYIVDLYYKRPGDWLPDGKQDVCNTHLKLCSDWMLPLPEDLAWSPEQQKEHLSMQGGDPYNFGAGYQAPPRPYDDEEMDAGELEMGVGDKVEL